MYYDAMIKLLFLYHCFRRDVCDFSLVKLIRLPKHVILVRDMRASLVSNNEKWKDQYGYDFQSWPSATIISYRSSVLSSMRCSVKGF